MVVRMGTGFFTVKIPVALYTGTPGFFTARFHAPAGEVQGIVILKSIRVRDRYVLLVIFRSFFPRERVKLVLALKLSPVTRMSLVDCAEISGRRFQIIDHRAGVRG